MAPSLGSKSRKISGCSTKTAEIVPVKCSPAAIVESCMSSLRIFCRKARMRLKACSTSSTGTPCLATASFMMSCSRAW